MVLRPTIPSAARPLRPFWNARTVANVSSPKMPSGLPCFLSEMGILATGSIRACWTRRTASPTSPQFMGGLFRATF